MGYNNIILPIFLEAKNGFINPFEKFDISHNIINEQYIKLCPICLNTCILPNIPIGCSHNFCFRCIKILPKTRKSCPYMQERF